MTIEEHIAAARAAIAAGRDEAAAHIVVVLELDPKRSLATLCREIDPDGWNALRARVQRLQEKRRSEGESGCTRSEPTENQRGSVRSAKAALRKHPELADDLIADPQVAETLRKRQAAKDAETIDHATAEPVAQFELTVYQLLDRTRQVVRKAQRVTFTGDTAERTRAYLASIREALAVLDVLIDAKPISDESIYEWMGERR